MATHPENIVAAIRYICRKHNVRPKKLRIFCLNKYSDKKTGTIFYLNNTCQCSDFPACNTCEDYWRWEWDHPTPHSTCVHCNYLKKYYEAQKDLYTNYGDLIPKEPDDENSFSFQKKFSVVFGGLPKVQFEELSIEDLKNSP